jgi:hypothetical protein
MNNMKAKSFQHKPVFLYTKAMLAKYLWMTLLNHDIFSLSWVYSLYSLGDNLMCSAVRVFLYSKPMRVSKTTTIQSCISQLLNEQIDLCLNL